MGEQNGTVPTEQAPMFWFVARVSFLRFHRCRVAYPALLRQTGHGNQVLPSLKKKSQLLALGLAYMVS